MTRLCAWCGRELEAGGPDAARTHLACPECEASIDRELRLEGRPLSSFPDPMCYSCGEVIEDPGATLCDYCERSI